MYPFNLRSLHGFPPNMDSETMLRDLKQQNNIGVPLAEKISPSTSNVSNQRQNFSRSELRTLTWTLYHIGNCTPTLFQAMFTRRPH